MPSEIILNENTYDYTTVQRTEKGYIFGGILYELDNKGRLIYAQLVDAKEEFIEYKDGKKYRTGADYITYTDSSYTSFGYYQPGNMVLGMSDRWVETTYVFDKNGNDIGRTVMISIDGISWRIWDKYEKEYLFNNEEIDVSNHRTALPKTNSAVYAYSGYIYIFTERSATAQIFSLTGRMIIQQAVLPGENRISVSTGGFYIVTVGNESFKVFVR